MCVAERLSRNREQSLSYCQELMPVAAKRETRNAKRETRNAKRETRNAQRSILQAASKQRRFRPAKMKRSYLFPENSEGSRFCCE